MRGILRRLTVVALAAVLMIAAFAPAASTAPAGYKYPSSVRAAFVRGCVKGGGSRAACTCTIKKIEKRYTLKQFVRISKRAEKTGKLPAAIVRMAKSCAKSTQG
jgi:hypothetical protein